MSPARLAGAALAAVVVGVLGAVLTVDRELRRFARAVR